MRLLLGLVLLGFTIQLERVGAQENLFVWSPTGALLTPRHSGCATPLADGRVLVAGGEGPEGTLATAELYGADGQFLEVAPMASRRSLHTCTLLSDGRVLATGGRDGESAVAGAEVYDAVENVWTPTADSGLARWGQTASLLSDGRVLLAGGETADGPSDALELFEPGGDRFVSIEARLSGPRRGHAAAVLTDGSVLLVGDAGGILNSDLFRPDTLVVEAGANLITGRTGATATTLFDGRVLLAGGREGDRDVSSTLLYDPRSDLWEAGPEMMVARSGHVAVPIPNNGGVLLIGGSSDGQATGSTEVFDPLDNRIVQVGGLTAARLKLMAAAQGEDGVVLAVGGLGESGPVAVCGTLIAPTMRPDKTKYFEGETVTMTGAHWLVGRSVQLEFAVRFVSNLLSTRSAVADQNGAVVITQGTNSMRGRELEVSARQSRGTSDALFAFSRYSVVVRTTATLTVTPAASAPAGAPVTLLAEVRPSAITRPDGSSMGNISGQVKFFAGSTLLGQVNSSSPDFQRDVNQFAFVTLRLPSLPAGGHSLVAVYEGNINYGPSEALKVSYAVNKRTAQASVTASSLTPKVGDNVTLTATVTGNGGVRPTGALRFRTDQGVIGEVTLTGAGASSATATISFRPGSAGAISVEAVYAGDAIYNTGVNKVSLNVAKAVAVLALVGGSTTVSLFDAGRYATNLDFTTGAIVPTGRVFLDVDGGPVTSMELSAAASPSAGRRLIELTQAFTGFSIGQHSVRFRYAGDSRFEAATSASRVTIVTKGQVGISVTFTGAAAAGAPMSFTAFIIGLGTLAPRPVATGTIQMFVDNISRQALTLSSTSPPATVTAAPITLTQGLRRFAFTYSGDGNYDGKLHEFVLDVR